MDVSLSKLWKLVIDRAAWHAVFHGVLKSHMIEWLNWPHSAYNLTKQVDNIQPWCTPFPILNQSVVPCPVLTVASWHTYRFLRRQVKSGIPISSRIFQFVVIHRIKALNIVNKAEVDVFLEFPCFPYDAMNVGNLISGSFTFSKSSLCIWKFSVHILLKPSLKDFENYLASMWNECSHVR